MAQQNLSLVPYNSKHHEVVLRHGSAIVLYNEESRRLSFRTVDDGVDIKTVQCPYCGKPFDKISRGHSSEVPVQPSTGDGGFLDPEYFRMLDESRNPSQQTSRSPSPQLRLADSSKAPQDNDDHNKESVHTWPPTLASKAARTQKIPENAFSQNYFKSFFVEEGELGRGGRGVVLLVRHVIDQVELGWFACKRIPVGDDSGWLRKVLVEVQLLQKLSHPNVVAYRHVWLENFQVNEFSPPVPCAFILQQYCNAGDLHEYIFGASTSLTKEDLKRQMRTRIGRQSEGVVEPQFPRLLTFEEIFSFFRDITSGLHYLHKNKYIHRDLKPSNCLLHTTGSQVRILVSDFGEMQETDAMRRSTGHTGTISFCAPEVLKRGTSGHLGNFSQKSDIFSLGLIVYLMCFGRLPYVNSNSAAEEHEDVTQLKEEISGWTGMKYEQKDRQDLPERLYKSLRLLLAVDPDERPSTEDILQSIKTGSVLHEASLRTDTSSSVLAGASNTADGRMRRPPLVARASAVDDEAQSTGFRRPSNPRLLSMAQGATATSTMVMRGRSVAELTLQPDNPVLLEDPRRIETLHTNKMSRIPLTWLCRLLFFAIKIVSCIVPCSPLGPTWIAIPLLILAAFDLSRDGHLVGSSVMLLALHFAVVLLANHFERFCQVI